MADLRLDIDNVNNQPGVLLPKSFQKATEFKLLWTQVQPKNGKERFFLSRHNIYIFKITYFLVVTYLVK